MNDTERLDKLEAALRDPKLKLNVTRDSIFVADIYDLRDWLDNLAKPRAYRKPPVRVRVSKVPEDRPLVGDGCPHGGLTRDCPVCGVA